MPNPLPLKFTATVVCMRVMLRENPVESSNDSTTASGSSSTKYLTRLLESDCLTAVSEEILHRIVKFCPESLTDRLLHALIPPYIQDLNLDSCCNLSLMGLVETLRKCIHLHRLNLSCCSQLVVPETFTFFGLSSIPLTTVILEKNTNVTDEVVHAMLRYLPGLKTLNISCCSNITNDVFLLDEDLQIPREVTPYPLEDDQYKYKLSNVDISGCSKFNAKAVVHLVSLCGPTLTSVDISWTSVDCTGLLYLAGYTLPAIIDFMLTGDALKSDKELKPLLQSYRELRDMFVEQYEKRDEPKKWNKPPKISKAFEESNVCEDEETLEKNVSDVLVETDIELEMPASSHTEDCDLDNVSDGKLLSKLDINQNNQEAIASIETQQDRSPADRGNIENPCRRVVHWRNGELVSDECAEHGENCETVWEDVDFTDNENEAIEDNLGIGRNDETKTGKNVQKHANPVVVGNEKLNFDYVDRLYQSKILSLNISGIKFASRRPYLGQLCLEKFFEANKSLKKFSVSWKGLTLDFLKKVVHDLTDLVEVELEECTLLQSDGIAAVGRNCHKLQRVNLRGVVFISDRALVPFLSNTSLQHLQLAESINIKDDILIDFSNYLGTSLESIDLSFCEEITEKGINAICSSCTNLKKIWLHNSPVSDFTLSLLSEAAPGLLEISVESVDSNGDSNLTDEGILTIANSFAHLRVINISWNLAITDLSVSAIMSSCSLLEEADFKGLKLITIQPFLQIISDVSESYGSEDSACRVQSADLPLRSTVYAPNLRVVDLDYSDLVDDQLLQKIVNVCRGTLKVTDYYGQKLEPEVITESAKPSD